MRRVLAQQFIHLQELNHTIKVRFDNNLCVLNQAIISDYPSFSPLERAEVLFIDFIGKQQVE